MDRGVRAGQGDHRAGNRAVGDGEDRGQDGGVGAAVSRAVWEVAWRPVKGPQAICSHDIFPLFSSPVFVATGLTLHPVTWHGVGTWDMFAEEMTEG